MSEPTRVPKSNEASAQAAPTRLWIKELPFVIVLALTIFGVGYTSISQQPLVGYWEFLALIIGVVCVSTGWWHATDKHTRFRIIWTQSLHWGAFLVAMNIVLLPGVQRVLPSTATGLVLLMLLALGTFVAGVHVAWQLCLLGLAMALCVPAIAWLAQSSLLVVLAMIAVGGIGLLYWRQRGERMASSMPNGT
jgi:hypothetical protein